MSQTITKITTLASYILFAFVLSVPKHIIHADVSVPQNLESSTIAKSMSKVDIEKENRIKTLETYFSTHNSPLTPYASIFVEEAYKNNLDWRLVAAISGVESTFGKHIPQGSYNGWGWDSGKYKFESWEEAIQIISETLNTKYAQNWGANTPSEIGKYYAASPTWASRVAFFMEKIEVSRPKIEEVAFNL